VKGRETPISRRRAPPPAMQQPSSRRESTRRRLVVSSRLVALDALDMIDANAIP
jgi:hypothetical protein